MKKLNEAKMNPHEVQRLFINVTNGSIIPNMNIKALPPGVKRKADRLWLEWQKQVGIHRANKNVVDSYHMYQFLSDHKIDSKIVDAVMKGMDLPPRSASYGEDRPSVYASHNAQNNTPNNTQATTPSNQSNNSPNPPQNAPKSIGLQQAKVAIDEVVALIKKVRSVNRGRVVDYAKQQLDAVNVASARKNKVSSNPTPQPTPQTGGNNGTVWENKRGAKLDKLVEDYEQYIKDILK